MQLNRRGFLASTCGAVLAAPMLSAQGRPRVVIVGGGAGGVTAARYIARDGAGALDVTLIEPSRTYHTCFFSNLYLGGFRDFESLGHTYGTVASEGINVIHDWAVGVDRDAKTVTLAGGGVLPWDRLILSPGIDFVDGSVPGWDLSQQNRMPHAYRAGSQTELLRAQVLAMPQGGVFAMIAPPNPYRCPPGPYERISMVAHALRETNPTAKIILIDPKESFSKQALFEEAWLTHYSGMIERIGPDFGGANYAVDPEGMTITIDGEVVKVDVANVIPAQKAGRIADIAGLTEGGWAPVSAFDLSSRIDPDVHVLGDSAAQGDMPKSAFAANSQAKVCSNAVLGALIGSTVFPPRFSNTCWSLLGTDDGVKVGATYEATEEKIASIESFVSQTGERADVRAATYEESLGWYDSITYDMFG